MTLDLFLYLVWIQKNLVLEASPKFIRRYRDFLSTQSVCARMTQLGISEFPDALREKHSPDTICAAWAVDLLMTDHKSSSQPSKICIQKHKTAVFTFHLQLSEESVKLTHFYELCIFQYLEAVGPTETNNLASAKRHASTCHCDALMMSIEDRYPGSALPNLAQHFHSLNADTYYSDACKLDTSTEHSHG